MLKVHWEGGQLAAHYKMIILFAIVDVMALGPTGQTLYVHHTEVFAAYSPVGWHVYQVDGHDVAALCAVMTTSKSSTMHQ